MVFLFFQQIDEDPSLVPEAIQGGTFGFNSSANVPAEGFQFQSGILEVRYNAALNKKKGLIHQSWLMGSAAALNRERKCEDFIWNHRKAQMKSRWRVGASENEWQNVMKNFTLNAYLDCSKKKGYRSKIFSA